MYLNKGQKLRDCCASAEADSRLGLIHHCAVEVKALAEAPPTSWPPRGLAVLLGEHSGMRAYQIFLSPSRKVHTPERMLCSSKLHSPHNHPMGRNAPLLSEESQRLGVTVTGNRDPPPPPGLPCLCGSSDAPPHWAQVRSHARPSFLASGGDCRS
ncbi:unnamed protein product [Rangifer tarandus platyrhynchus]|uniref:Uncharacterized protein n=1 Tax=Rangifer tarandus platyrhynchus TaxID=3082113 RepID=A0AC60A9L1_RANTA